MLRSLLSTVIGVLAAVLIVLIMQALAGVLFPAGKAYDPDAPAAEIANYIASQPLPALLWGLLGDAMGATGGVFVAAHYAQPNRLPAVIVSVFLIVGMISNVTALPYPIWLSIASVAAVTIGALTGFGLSAGRPAKS
ncbi:MAG: hypothetical protein AAF862_12920 [Pseudomonadota bacterium]